jgi:hypothetical protein
LISDGVLKDAEIIANARNLVRPNRVGLNGESTNLNAVDSRAPIGVERRGVAGDDQRLARPERCARGKGGPPLIVVGVAELPAAKIDRRASRVIDFGPLAGDVRRYSRIEISSLRVEHDLADDHGRACGACPRCKQSERNNNDKPAANTHECLI